MGTKLCIFPEYSPFLNPIENVFSKWKNYVRKERCNNENELFQKIDDGLKLVTQKDCGVY